MLAGIFLALPGLYAQTAQPGKITGKILGPDGLPLRGAVVSAHFISNSASKPAAVPLHTATLSDGSFAIASAPPGSYRICIQTSTAATLDPCQWSSTPPTITVGAGPISKVASFAVEKGHPVQIHIEDPQGLLLANEGKKAGAHLLVGVWTARGLFVPMPIITSQVKSRDHQIYIPYDSPITLSVYSKAFKMIGATGKDVDQRKGDSVPIQVSTGTQTAVTGLYRVVGVNP